MIGIAIGLMLVSLAIFACIISRIIKKVEKHADDVITKADRLMDNMDDVDSDLMEIKQQIRELSGTLYEILDEDEEYLVDKDDDDYEYIDPTRMLVKKDEFEN